MSRVTVVRWRRYGKDRLYVNGVVDGSRLGWHDLTTGDTHVDVTDRAAEVTDAVANWLAAAHEQPAGNRDLPPTPNQEPPAVIEPVTPAKTSDEEPSHPAPPADVAAAAEPEEDLASRAAGAMAREQASRLREAAPVKTFLARVLRVHTDERAWRIGADGEERVAARLDKLRRKDPRWRFLNAIPVGEKGDIDHLVIGPGGVFTLNSKNHPGANVWVGGDVLMVNGQRHPYISRSRHEATRAARLLTAATGIAANVTGVLVVVGVRDLRIKTAPGDVHVLDRQALVRWLSRRPELLDEATCDAIFEVARRPATWAAPPRG